jgi:hypothetical protein
LRAIRKQNAIVGAKIILTLHTLGCANTVNGRLRVIDGGFSKNLESVEGILELRAYRFLILTAFDGSIRAMGIPGDWSYRLGRGISCTTGTSPRLS